MKTFRDWAKVDRVEYETYMYYM